MLATKVRTKCAKRMVSRTELVHCLAMKVNGNDSLGSFKTILGPVQTLVAVWEKKNIRMLPTGPCSQK